MPALKNFVAVDWRSGKDKLYFFFKDSNMYSRFDIGDNQVPEGYLTAVNYGNWGSFHENTKDLCFGFTTTGIDPADGRPSDLDILWLFYKDGDTPIVCKYNQDTDKPIRFDRVEDTVWRPLLAYFDRIIAGTWWQGHNSTALFRFLMSDGNSLYLDLNVRLHKDLHEDLFYTFGDPSLSLSPITDSTWPGLEHYKDRIITAAQNDRTLGDSYLYIFLTDNEYITYNIPKNRVEHGPHAISDVNWPGLLRDLEPSAPLTVEATLIIG